MLRLGLVLLLAPFFGCQSAPEGVLAGTITALSAGGVGGFVAPGDTVVVAVTLQDCPPGSRCEVVLYWNGQFQDHQSLRIKKPGTTTEYLRWPPGPYAKVHRPGKYLVKVFLNGRFARQVDYTVG